MTSDQLVFSTSARWISLLERPRECASNNGVHTVPTGCETSDGTAVMLRIAHIGSKGVPSGGGTERVVEAVGMRHAVNHEVTVYGSRLVCRTGAYCGMRVEALPTSPGKRLGPVLSDLSAAAHCLVRRRFDVVHLHGSENSFILPALRLRYPWW